MYKHLPHVNIQYNHVDENDFFFFQENYERMQLLVQDLQSKVSTIIQGL